ncbi:MAG: hypothetical protein IPI48_02195 [bacterium]|nr:hypothetical protein [bacterium]
MDPLLATENVIRFVNEFTPSDRRTVAEQSPSASMVTFPPPVYEPAKTTAQDP